MSPAQTASSTVIAASRPWAGSSLNRSRKPRPPPIQTAPITVPLIAIVAAARASEIAFSTNASTNVVNRPPTAQLMPPTSAPTSASTAPT